MYKVVTNRKLIYTFRYTSHQAYVILNILTKINRHSGRVGHHLDMKYLYKLEKNTGI